MPTRAAPTCAAARRCWGLGLRPHCRRSAGPAPPAPPAPPQPRWLQSGGPRRAQVSPRVRADSPGTGGLTGEGAGQAESPRSPDAPPARRLGAPLCADPLPGLPVRWGDPARGSGKAAGRTSREDGKTGCTCKAGGLPLAPWGRRCGPQPPELEGRLWSSDALPGNWKPLGAKLSRSPSGGCGKGPRDPW